MDEDDKKEIAEELGIEPEEAEEMGDSEIEARKNGAEEEIIELIKDHDIDEETAEKAQELIDEGLDEDDAVALAEEL
jgi:hypothetical protein